MEHTFSYRSAINAADVLAAVVQPTCTKLAGGAATAGQYTVAISAGNKYGRTVPTAGDTTVTTETTNLTVRAAWAKVTGAEFYDIFCSVDGAAAKWVGRITEAQRLAGGTLTAVNTYASTGGIAGAIDIEVPGTGLAANTIVVSNAFNLPAVFALQHRQLLAFDIEMARTGEAVAASLIVVPFFWNVRAQQYFLDSPVTVAFGGATGVYGGWKQRVPVSSSARSVGLLVASIAGTGASATIYPVVW
jgi:hypothetical protein